MYEKGQIISKGYWGGAVQGVSIGENWEQNHWEFD